MSVANYYQYAFEKDSDNPPTLEDRIIGTLLAGIPVDDPTKDIVKFDLNTMRPVICRK